MDTLLCKTYTTALPVIKSIDLAQAGVSYDDLIGHVITVGNQTYTLANNATSTTTGNVFGDSPTHLAQSLANAVNGDWDSYNVTHKKGYDNLSCYANARGSKVFFIGRIEGAAFTLTSAGTLLTITTITAS